MKLARFFKICDPILCVSVRCSGGGGGVLYVKKLGLHDVVDSGGGVWVASVPRVNAGWVSHEQDDKAPTT